MKINYWMLKDEAGEVIEEYSGISIKTAKSLLKEKGGIAYSCQYRGGDLVGTTDITLGNNAKTRKSVDASRKDVGKRIVNEVSIFDLPKTELPKEYYEPSGSYEHFDGISFYNASGQRLRDPEEYNCYSEGYTPFGDE